MKYLLLAALLTSTAFSTAQSNEVSLLDTNASLLSRLEQKKWNHGATDCTLKPEPAIEVFRFDASSYILRQSKCLSFEAPFIYVLFGDERVLVLDTGATESALEFPLYETVKALMDEQSALDGKLERKLLVMHSHGHGDHYAGDSQFDGKPNVTLVKPNRDEMVAFFGFGAWPKGEASVDLGGRKLSILPTPGHQEEAITLFDPHTGWLLTGDTFYPGYVYVKDWNAYKNSIVRLVAFASTHEVSAVLGAHIEMTDKAGEYYPIGTLYQPHEASLVLSPEILTSLDLELQQLKKPKTILLDELIVEPMGGFQKAMSNIARWIVQ